VTERRYRRAVAAALLVMGAPLLLSLVGFARGAEPEPFLAPARQAPAASSSRAPCGTPT